MEEDEMSGGQGRDERGDVSVESNSPDTFGGCPVCGRNDGFLNVGRAHWFVCDEHMTKWCVGNNWFRCWRRETEEIWKENASCLSAYREVAPVTRARDDTDNGKAAVPNDVLEAISTVVRYLWDDERKHCCSCKHEPATQHIFNSLIIVRNWLDDDTLTVDALLGED